MTMHIKKLISLTLAILMVLSCLSVSASEEIIAEYNLDAAGGYSSYGTVNHNSTGKDQSACLTFYNGFVKFPYTAVSGGQYVIEFQVKIVNGDNTLTASLEGASGSVDVKAWNWVNSDGDTDTPNCGWTDIKLEVDVDGGKVLVYKDGVLNLTHEDLENLSDMNKLSFTRWGTREAYIDNVKIYKPTCSVSGYTFSDLEGNLSTDIDSFSSYPKYINISFATEMDTATVVPELLKNGETISFNPSWDSYDKVLTITPTDEDRAFTSGNEYKLIIPAGYTDKSESVGTEDFVLEFERTVMAGAIANFDMETVKSGITGAYNTTRTYPERGDEAGGKYLDFYDDYAVFEFGEALTSGTLTIEFDFCNIVTNANIHTTVWIDEDGKTGGVQSEGYQLKGNAEGWTSYKWIVDFENDTIDIYKNGEFLETLTDKGVDELSQIKGIGFVRWGGKTNPINVGIDNLRAYVSEIGIKNYNFYDFGGNKADKVEGLSEAVEGINVEFANEPVEDSLDITLYNKTSSEEIPTNLEINGRYLKITAQQGYFNAMNDFELVIGEGYSNRYGYVGKNGLTLEFNTGEKVFGLKSIDILKNGVPASFSDISAGDTLSFEVKYVLTDADKAPEVILAVTAEKDSKITSFSDKKVTLSDTGLATAVYPFVIEAGAEFDSCYAYIWDAALRIPKVSCKTITDTSITE